MPLLDRKMLVATLVTGIGAGIGGVLLTLLLRLVEHIAFGYTGGTFLPGVEQASATRRVLGVGVGGVVVGVGWWLQRRHIRTDVSLRRALVEEGRRLPFGPSIIDSVIQIVAVGAGASLGREGAPRLFGAASGAWISRQVRLSEPQRRTVVACGAGAGFAAVYNVPLGGALFTAEVLLGSLALAEVAPALLSSAIATAVAWPVLGDRATYEVPHFSLNIAILVWAVLFGPIAGVVAVGFRILSQKAEAQVPGGWHVAVAVTLAFIALGALAIPFPQVLGNGKGPAQAAFTDTLGLGVLAMLVLLKPLATALCLRAGARGGLLTPALATGAVLGGATGMLWSHLWSGTPSGAYALVGAAAVLATTQRAPLMAVVLAIEFTHAGLSLVAPMLLAVALALGTGQVLQGQPAPRPRLSS